MSSGSDEGFNSPRPAPHHFKSPYPSFNVSFPSTGRLGQVFAPQASSSAPDLSLPSILDGTEGDGGSGNNGTKSRAKQTSYRSHFKRRYMVETAWRTGGRVQSRQITPDQGVVTSLHLTDKYIVVALDNAKIHVFDVHGSHQRTLHGHMMGVWAMVPWDDILVSGGCDRDVRVWNMATGLVVQQGLSDQDTDSCSLQAKRVHVAWT